MKELRCREHAPNTLVDVYTAEARQAIEEGDYNRAESFLLRANKPDIILRLVSLLKGQFLKRAC